MLLGECRPESGLEGRHGAFVIIASLLAFLRTYSYVVVVTGDSCLILDDSCKDVAYVGVLGLPPDRRAVGARGVAAVASPATAGVCSGAGGGLGLVGRLGGWVLVYGNMDGLADAHRCALQPPTELNRSRGIQDTRCRPGRQGRRLGRKAAGRAGEGGGRPGAGR